MHDENHAVAMPAYQRSLDRKGGQEIVLLDEAGNEIARVAFRGKRGKLVTKSHRKIRVEPAELLEQPQSGEE